MAGAARGLTDQQIAASLTCELRDIETAMARLSSLVASEGRAARAAIVDYGYRTGLLSDLMAEPRKREGAWLTTRRLAILELIAYGRTDRQIADAVGCAPKAVTAAVHHILRHLDAEDRAHAVALAHQQELLTQALMPLPSHSPVRAFTLVEAQLVRALAAGRTKRQIRTSHALSAKTATRLLSGAADAAGVPVRRGYAALVDSAYRGRLLIPRAFDHGSVPQLPERHVQVLVGIAHGWSDERVADQLRLATATVKTAARLMYGTLGAATRAQAVARGWELRLLGAPMPAISATTRLSTRSRSAA
ncbi:LuxR C-terminal-related transcriptional regulator [Streptomyces sp. NPDC006692]|uniref:LuxR C-terminal-related transcriptional regulator n=1 Tax=unclassified Streptomyces TaxID=2593676 RepID=UPI003437FE73